MRYGRAEGTTCSLIVISNAKRQVDMQRYVITFIVIPSLTTSKIILFYTGISAPDPNIFEPSTNFTLTFYIKIS